MPVLVVPVFVPPVPEVALILFAEQVTCALPSEQLHFHFDAFAGSTFAGLGLGLPRVQRLVFGADTKSFPFEVPQDGELVVPVLVDHLTVTRISEAWVSSLIGFVQMSR